MATVDDYPPFAGSADGDGYQVVGVDLSSGPGYVALSDEFYHNLILATRAEGAAAERARIRKLALDEADKIDRDEDPRDFDEHADVAVRALRDFAALLEEPGLGGTVEFKHGPFGATPGKRGL